MLVQGQAIGALEELEAALSLTTVETLFKFRLAILLFKQNCALVPEYALFLLGFLLLLRVLFVFDLLELLFLFGQTFLFNLF